MQQIDFVPSKIYRHRANPNKASQILGINSNAVILANARHKKLAQHRKSNSFSSVLQTEESKSNDSEIMDDAQLNAQTLKFDAFKTQKRNTGSRKIGHLGRSQTVDFTNSPHLQSLEFTVNDEKNRRIAHNLSKNGLSKRTRS